MSTTINRSSGLRVTLPEGFTLSGSPAAAARGPIVRGPTGRLPPLMPMPGPTAAAATANQVAAAMEDQDMVLVDTLPLVAAPTPRGATRAAVAGEVQEVAIDVDLAPDESAAVLIEQDGFYAWHFGSRGTPPPPPPSAVRGGTKSSSHTMSFRLSLEGSPKDPAKSRSWLGDLVIGQAQAFVFKFAGRFLLGRGAAFLERKVRTGVVSLDGDDPTGWKDLGDFSALKLPSDRPARILLFVHGTFSSTRGGFGGLCATPWGRAFLAAARANYDVVIGFDHKTLGDDPLANATSLLQSMESRKWDQPAIIDAISHSRGGIVLRSLVEYLLPSTDLPVTIDRAVFVGAVNAGTEFAEPGNWGSLIDMYTNVATAACRAIAQFPQATFAAVLTGEVLKGVGVLVKVLAEEATTGRVVPGLAAMRPTGDFITDLNTTQPGQPSPDQIRYYAVTSEFRGQIALTSPNELPRRLLLMVADGFVDRLMGKGVANDLVVNTGSMTSIDPGAGAFIRDTLGFGENGVVYHTNYFLQPQVANALARWLELELAAVASPSHVRGAVRGGGAPVNVPARMDTDVLVAMAEDLGSATLARIKLRAPSYVVVNRLWQSTQLHYAFPTEMVIQSIEKRPGAILLDALDIHEPDASAQGPVDALPPPANTGGRPSARLVVGMEGGMVVGVVEPAITPFSISDLVKQAETIESPRETHDFILRRRAMPTFAKDMARERPRSSPPPTLSSPRRTTRSARGGSTSGTLASASPLESTGVPEETGAGFEASPKVKCRFLAEMYDEVVKGELTSVDVTLSRDAIRAVREVAASGTAAVQPSQKITVEIIPTKNFVTAGPARIDIDLPAPGSPAVYPFDVTATDEGEGEILVRIRQQMQPLANLSLRCTIVAARAKPPTRRPPQVADVLDSPILQQPKHQLTIMEIERGGQLHYYYTLTSPSLNLQSTYESKPFTGSREAYIKSVYQDIESRYLSNTTDFDRFQEELRQVGGQMWDELFPPEMQAALWKSRNSIDSIQVISIEPFIPWELVHLKEPGKGLGAETRFLGQMGLVRWLPNNGWPPEVLRARKGRCHYVIPSYPHPTLRLPGAEAEATFLEKHFDAKPVVPHAAEVQNRLEEPGGFDLLHFACHGEADSGSIAQASLLLEGRVEPNGYVKEEFRASVIENLTTLIGPDGVQPIITLNACQVGRAGYKLTSTGGFSSAFLKRGAGMLVSAMWSVGDAPARTFTEKLYERLLFGDTLAEASIAARAAAQAAKESTWLAYTVYGNPYARLTHP